MGRSYTTRYAVRLRVDGHHMTDACWRGRATDKALRAHVQAFEDSTLPGGCNEHLGVMRVAAAEIVTNDSERRVMASYFGFCQRWSAA